MSSAFNALDLASPLSNPKVDGNLSCLDLAPKPGEYVIVKTPIHCLGEKFTPMTEIAVSNIKTLVANQILEPKEAAIYCYPRQQISRFNFKNNGFEFCRITGAFSDSLKHLAKTPESSDSRANVRKTLVPYLTQWGKTQGIDFDTVIPVDTVYRNTNLEVKNAFGAVPLAHVDFPEANYPQTLLNFEQTWKPRVEEGLHQTLTSSEYSQLNVAQAINIWIPLNEHNTENTLAVMDISTLNEETELQLYSAVRRDQTNIVSLGVNGKPHHKWVVESDMKFGDAIIFNSLRTPHTALDVPKIDCDPYRHSVEIRVLFVSERQNSKHKD